MIGVEYLHVVATVALGLVAGIWSVLTFIAKARREAEAKVSSEIKQLTSRVEAIEREYISREALAASYDRLERRVMDGLSRLDVRLDELWKAMRHE